MSIDFSTLQGLTIPEGVVTQITDANGDVLWEKALAREPISVVANNTDNHEFVSSSPYTAISIDGENI